MLQNTNNNDNNVQILKQNAHNNKMARLSPHTIEHKYTSKWKTHLTKWHLDKYTLANDKYTTKWNTTTKQKMGSTFPHVVVWSHTQANKCNK